MGNINIKKAFNSMSELELNHLLIKHDFLTLSECGEYIIIKTRDLNKKDLKIHKNNSKLRQYINQQIPLKGKKVLTKEQNEINKVKAHLKRILKLKKEEFENREKLINTGISKLSNSELNSKEMHKAIKTIIQSIDSLLLNS